MASARSVGSLAAADELDNRLRESLADVFARVAAPWRSVTEPFVISEPGRALADFVDGRVRAGVAVYPRQVLRALEFVPPQRIRAVILGQDPYHGAGQAQGLAFAVGPHARVLPPSLRNILREVHRDTGLPSAGAGDLSAWARQGVLLLNAVLTVEDGMPQSHAGQGWEVLTDALLARVAAQSNPVAFMLWGASAQRKRTQIDAAAGAAHAVLACNHPSPLSARRGPVPFVGCGHFSRANSVLQTRSQDAEPIAW